MPGPASGGALRPGGGGGAEDPLHRLDGRTHLRHAHLQQGEGLGSRGGGGLGCWGGVLGGGGREPPQPDHLELLDRLSSRGRVFSCGSSL